MDNTGNIERRQRRNPQAGITMVETLMAGAILIIGSLGMIGLIVNSIATNNRSKIDSTQTMLSEAIVEHVNSTVIGSGSSVLTDCAGTSYTISGLEGGATLNSTSSAIDFTENIAANAAKTNYHMDYYINTPCTSTGTLQAIYDVRWNVQKVGGSTTPTNTYLLTVSAKMKNHGEGNLFFSLPVTLRVMSGN
jgi:Tfp pilus assembly protein PilV